MAEIDIEALTGGDDTDFQAIIDGRAVKTLTPVVALTANYTLLLTDTNKFFIVTSATDVTITIPNNLPVGWGAMFKQAGAGRIVFAAASGGTLENVNGHTKSSAIKAVVSLFVDSNSSGTAALIDLIGSTAA